MISRPTRRSKLGCHKASSLQLPQTIERACSIRQLQLTIKPISPTGLPGPPSRRLPGVSAPTSMKSAEPCPRQTCDTGSRTNTLRSERSRPHDGLLTNLEASDPGVATSPDQPACPALDPAPHDVRIEPQPCDGQEGRKRAPSVSTSFERASHRGTPQFRMAQDNTGLL